MFSQSAEKDPSKSSQKQKSTHKKRKKQRQKNKKKQAIQIKQSLANSMSTWAEHFTMAATWQLKHQVAMWKSRAMVLQYENQVLRETLQQFYVGGRTNPSCARGTPNTNRSVHNRGSQLMDYEQSYTDSADCAPSASATKQDSDDSSEKEESEFELEMSEEFIAFIKQNFEYRKAREERKKREADEERRKETAELNDPAPAVDREEEFKELYGDSWQRIAALDLYLSSDFVVLCDTEKPNFWPNIPLRL